MQYTGGILRILYSIYDSFYLPQFRQQDNNI